MHLLNSPKENGHQFPVVGKIIEHSISKTQDFELWYHQQFQTKVVEQHIKRMIDFKKSFNFVCLLEDDRIKNLYDDCGLKDMPLYLNLTDQGEGQCYYVNGLYFKKVISYKISMGHKKVTWLDLWKTIDDLVKMNGYDEEVVISHINIYEAKDKDDFKYARAIIKRKPDSFE